MYGQNGWECGVTDRGRLIKHLHSAETYPYASVYLELTSGESRFFILNWGQAALFL